MQYRFKRRSAIKKHDISSKHSNVESNIRVTSVFNMKGFEKPQINKIKVAEIRLASFIIEHNVSIQNRKMSKKLHVTVQYVHRS